MSLTWKRSLLFWTAHGLTCALPSFIWAIIGGFVTPIAICAMLGGVAILVLIYTWLSLRTRLSIDRSYGFIATSIRWAAHLRASFSVLTILSFPLYLFSRGNLRYSDRHFIHEIAQVLIALDLYPGLAAIYLVRLVFPYTNQPRGSSNNFTPEFFDTFITTLVTGVIFSVIFIFIVLAVRVMIWAARKIF